jgi:hypothetical protein
MEGTQSGTHGRKPALTKRKLIVEAWDRLGRPTVGERELSAIQTTVRDRFGEGAQESPAAIARVLADEDAELRHPEVIEFDARWREAKIESDGKGLKGLDDLVTGKPLRFRKAEALLKKLEKLRNRAEGSGDNQALRAVRSTAVSARQMAELLAKDRKLDQHQRAEQAEIAEWFKVWIQTPSLFADWLELRRRSAEFQKRFLDNR